MLGLGHAPAGHMGRPSCLDGPRSLGCVVPSPAGLGGSPGTAQIGSRASTTQISSYRVVLGPSQICRASCRSIKPGPDGQI
jgi:hypothetical protein